MVWGVFACNGTIELQVVQSFQTPAGYISMFQKVSYRLCGQGWYFQ